MKNEVGMAVQKATYEATPSCTTVSGPGFFQGPYTQAVHQHHSHQYKHIRLAWNANFCD